MMRRAASLGLVAVSFLFACGGNVVLDMGSDGRAGSGGGAGSGGVTGSGGGTGSAGSTGAGGAPATCPSSSAPLDFFNLEGKSCTASDQPCTFNDGCGICSLSCLDGTWQPTNTTVCPPTPPTC